MDHDPEPIHESVATEDPVVPRLRPWGLGRLTDPRLHEAPVRRLRVGAAELTGPGGKQLLVSDPVEAAPAEGVSRVARPRPLLRPRNHSSPHGIEVNVAGEDPEIGLVLDQFRPIASLEEMPAEPMTASPPVGIGREQQLHTPGEVGSGRFEHQVEMIGHQHEGVEDPPRTMNCLLQPAEQPLPVRVVANNVLPGVAAGHDVVNRISILDTKAARHEPI